MLVRLSGEASQCRLKWLCVHCQGCRNKLGTSVLVTATMADGHRQRGQGVQCWLPNLPALIQKMLEPGKKVNHVRSQGC